MACLVIRNKSGEIINVLLPNGNKSELFDSLVKNPLVQNNEDAYQAYKNVLTPKFKKLSEDILNNGINPAITYKDGEPKLFYKTKGGFITTSYKEALGKTVKGGVELGFIMVKDVLNTQDKSLFDIANNDLVVYNNKYRLNNQEGFTKISEIDSNSNPKTRNGFINHSIRKDLLSDYKVMVGDRYYHRGRGELESTSIYNTQLVSWEASVNLGVKEYKSFSDGTIEFYDRNKDEISLPTKEGVTVTVSKEAMKLQLEQGKFNELDKQYVNMLGTALHLFLEDNARFRDKLDEVIPEEQKKDARIQLLGVLSDLGISTTSIVDYNTKYKIKNGEDPSIEALADMTNNVVAFAEGKESVENIAEETAHFIVEGYTNQEEINRLLPDVEQTKEWSDYNAVYRDKYKDSFQGVELDNIVRREVLGKVLRNKIVDRFNKVDATAEQGNFIDKLKGIWDSFVEYIKGLFSPSMRSELDKLTDSLADKVLNKEIQNYYSPELVAESKFVYFSISNKKAIVTLEAAVEELKKQLTVLRGAKDVTSVRVQEDIKRLTNLINKNDELRATLVLVGGIDVQVKGFQKLLRRYAEMSEANKKGLAWFTPAEQVSFRILSQTMLPLLRELAILIERGDIPNSDKVNVDSLLLQMKTLSESIANLEVEAGLQIESDVETVTDNFIAKYNISNQQAENIKTKLKNIDNDTSGFQRLFGSIEHASNPFLNMLGKLVSDTLYKADTKLFKNLNPFLNKIEAEGWKLEDFKRIIQVNDKGEVSGYLSHAIHMGMYEEAKLKNTTEIYNQVFGTKLTPTEYTKNLYNGKIKSKEDWDITKREEFNRLVYEWKLQNTERAYTDKFYQDREKLYKDLDISIETRELLETLSHQRYSALKKFIKLDGDIDYRKLRDEDPRAWQQLSGIITQRKEAKVLLDSDTGQAKEGTRLRVAEDLNKLDKHFADSKDKFQIKDSFYNNLEGVEATEGVEAALDFLLTNGGIVFNDKFWDAFKDKQEKMVDRLRRIAGEIRLENIDDSDRLVELADRIELLTQQKTEILKQYSVPNNPSEIQYSILPDHTKTNLKVIETELQELFRDTNTLLDKNSETQVVEATMATEVTPNRAYHAALEDSGKAELDFIKLHLTDSDSNYLDKMSNIIKGIKKGSDFIDGKTKRFLERYLQIEWVDMNQLRESLEGKNETVLTIEYAKTRLLPYFKRFAPEGYNEFLQGLQTGEQSVVEFVNFVRERDAGNVDYKGDITDFLSVSTQFSWTEDEAGATMLNPNYNPDWEGGMEQPKFDKYKDKKYFDYFGIKEQDYIDKKDLKATRNQKDWNMINTLTQHMRTGLEAYGESDTHSIYMLPQKSMGQVERLKSFLTKRKPGQTLANTLRDIGYNRVDDLGGGARKNNEDIKDFSSVRMIPKYYLTRLEENSDISTELAYSYTSFLQAAFVYEGRSAAISQAKTLEMGLLKQKFANGKDAKDSNAMAMFSNFMDAYFYGVKRSRPFYVNLATGQKIDMAKLIMGLDNYIRKVNIGFQPAIAATSWVTAELFLRIEQYIGEYINRDSSSWALKEFAKLAPSTVSEVGKISRTARMYALGERFGINQIVERTLSSGFGRGVRLLNNPAYKFIEIANFPIAYKVMFSVLDDIRLVDNRFIRRLDFNKLESNKGLSKKEKQNKWSELRDKKQTMYHMMEQDEHGSVVPKQELIDKLGEEYVEQEMAKAALLVKKTNSKVDSVVPTDDKSAATRDYMLRFTTAHRGWFTIGVQRKFKRDHFNFATGQQEEGHYTSLWKFAESVYANMKENNHKNIIKAGKEVWGQLEDYQVRNFLRAGIELGTLISLIGFGLIVAGFADDEDNEDLWALQFAAYIYFRTTSEVASVQLPSAIGGAVDMMNTPFVALNAVREVVKAKSWGFGEIESGSYEGHTKLYKTLAKLTWARHWYSMKNIKATSDYYRKANEETLMALAK